MRCRVCGEHAGPSGLCRKHYKLDYQRRHPDKRKQYYKTDYAKHKERYRQNSYAWAAANRQKTLEIGKRWRDSDPERTKRLKREWRRNNPEKMRAEWSRVQARRYGAPGRHTAEQVIELLAKQKGRCAVCRHVLDRTRHKDHILPISLGGSNDISNIQLLCASCNQSKGAHDPIAFMQSRGHLL